MFSAEFRSAGRKIYLARFVSFVGSAFTEFAIPLYLLQHSGNVRHVGMQWALTAFTRILSGYWAPRIRFFRHDRQALATLDLVAAGATLLPLAFEGPGVVVACYVTTLVSAFLSTAQAGFIDSLVGAATANEPRREAARAWLLSKIENGRYLGLLAGYGLAYTVSANLGFRAAFMIDAASFAVSAWLLSTVSAEGHSTGAVVRMSYSVLWRSKIRVLTCAQALAGFGLFLYNALHVIVMKTYLGASNAQLTWLYLLQYVGYFLGSRVPGLWVERTGRPPSDWVTVGLRFAMVGAFVAFAVSNTPWMFVGTNAVFSFLIAANLPGAAGLFQRSVARDELRAMGAARAALTSFFGALGAAFASWAVQPMGPTNVFWFAALVYLVSGGCMALYVSRRPA